MTEQRGRDGVGKQIAEAGVTAVENIYELPPVKRAMRAAPGARFAVKRIAETRRINDARNGAQRRA